MRIFLIVSGVPGLGMGWVVCRLIIIMGMGWVEMGAGISNFNRLLDETQWDGTVLYGVFGACGGYESLEHISVYRI